MTTSILHSKDAPPFGVPHNHKGLTHLPGTGRLVYWTGRVAIGLRFTPPATPATQSALWVQTQLLGGAS